MRRVFFGWLLCFTSISGQVYAKHPLSYLLDFCLNRKELGSILIHEDHDSRGLRYWYLVPYKHFPNAIFAKVLVRRSEGPANLVADAFVSKVIAVNGDRPVNVYWNESLTAEQKKETGKITISVSDIEGWFQIQTVTARLIRDSRIAATRSLLGHRQNRARNGEVLFSNLSSPGLFLSMLRLKKWDWSQVDVHGDKIIGDHTLILSLNGSRSTGPFKFANAKLGSTSVELPSTKIWGFSWNRSQLSEFLKGGVLFPEDILLGETLTRILKTPGTISKFKFQAKESEEERRAEAVAQRAKSGS